MLSAVQLLRLKQAAHDAVLCEVSTRVPSELTVSQWALESGWGNHQPGNNCFGIKSYPGCFGVQSLETHEFVHHADTVQTLEFATFASLATCFEKHGSLISGGRPYAIAWTKYTESNSVEELIRGIAPIYATAPNYAEQLLGIIAMAQVKASIAEFKQAMKPVS